MALDIATAEANWALYQDDDAVTAKVDAASDLIEAYLHDGEVQAAFEFAGELIRTPPRGVPVAGDNAAIATCMSWISIAQLAIAMASGGQAGLRRAHRAAVRADEAVDRLRKMDGPDFDVSAQLRLARAVRAVTRIAIAGDAEEASEAYERFCEWETGDHPALMYLAIEALLRAGQFDLARATAQDIRHIWETVWPEPTHPIYARCLRIADGFPLETDASVQYANVALKHAIHNWEQGLDSWLQPTAGAANHQDLMSMLLQLRNAAGNFEAVLDRLRNGPLRDGVTVSSDGSEPFDDAPQTDVHGPIGTEVPVRSQLAALVGLEGVKSHIERLEQNLRAQQLRKEKGLKPFDVGGHHLVFTGNPGTGKTTVARLIGRLYLELGLLDIGHVVEVNRSGLVGRYIGQTEEKTLEVLQSALGGVLFIDEAYALHPGDSGRDFGARVIDEVVKFASDHDGELVIILAGYPDEMQQLLDVNPGLRSRFSRVFDFSDLTNDELITVFQQAAVGYDYYLGDSAEARLRDLLARIPHDRNFGNARTVLDLFKRTVERHGARVANLDDPTDDELQELTGDDIPPIGDLVVDPVPVATKGSRIIEGNGLYL